MILSTSKSQFFHRLRWIKLFKWNLNIWIYFHWSKNFKFEVENLVKFELYFENICGSLTAVDDHIYTALKNSFSYQENNRFLFSICGDIISIPPLTKPNNRESSPDRLQPSEETELQQPSEKFFL